MKHLTTVLFRKAFGFVPGWLALILVLGGISAAAVPVFNGSVAVPAGGSIVLKNATSTSWAPITADSQCLDSNSINCVVGSVQQNVNYTGSNGSFPTGVTGYGYMNGTGNQAFGVFGRCDLYQNGACTNEFDSFNYSGVDPNNTFPPDQSFGTADHIATALQVAAYGNNKSKVGLQVSAGSQPFLAGIYVNPNAVSTYGAFIGAPTSGTGVQINGANSATSLGLQVNGGFTGSGPTNFITFADANNTNGVNVLLGGNGATTPNKTLRVMNGSFQILNSAYSSAIFTLADNGTTTLSNTTNISAGDLQLTGGSSQKIKLTDASATPNKYLRASGGAFQVVNSAFSTAILSLDDSGNETITGKLTAASTYGCSSNSGFPCHGSATCSISAGTTCSTTITVPTGSTCTATGNGSDTTTGTESWYLSLSTNTLTVTARVSASQTTTAAANITCL